MYIKKKGYYFTTLKTESSKRYILIDDFLLDELKHWHAQQAENERQVGDSYIYTYLENDRRILRQSKGLPCDKERVQLVCVKPNGGLVLRGTIISKLQAEGLNALSFRHTHATVLTEDGVVPEVVSERLGHKNPNSTLNVYVHNTPKVQEQAFKLQEETLAIFNEILAK